MFLLRTCSHCHQAFERRIFGVNLFIRRYEICPHCHRFTEVHYMPPIPPEGPGDESTNRPLSEEDALRKRIDESRYEGHQ